MFVETTLFLSSCMITTPAISLGSGATAQTIQEQTLDHQQELINEIQSDLNSELHIAPAAFQDTADTTDTTPSATFASEGSQRWALLGGWGIDVKHSSNNEMTFGAKWEYFIADGFAFAPELKLWGFFQDGGSTKNVPINGSEFNFTPQAGLGITWDIGEGNRWFAGVRWHHISNAGLYSDNPGRDSVLVYTGLSMPF
jgi:hypothetical protein